MISSMIKAATNTNLIKTRFCIISDTHATPLLPPLDSSHPYRQPLPPADVLLHAGDLSEVGSLEEYQVTIDVLKSCDAELKIVIGGSHDLSLDPEYMALVDMGGRPFEGPENDTWKVMELWKGPEAQAAGIVYLEEGIHTFELKNGAKFTIYATPYTPMFRDLAFAYPHKLDRFNCMNADNRIPSFPAIDVLLTHGPPWGILDLTRTDEHAGCPWLLSAVKRVRPRMHCFGHIHEEWGAEKRDWQNGAVDRMPCRIPEMLEERAARLDVSRGGPSPLEFGRQTLFVNASIMSVHKQPRNAPWLIDVDLPAKE
ncbi:hypothetical protein MMC13_000815 [Lambiella insularis]|nr:hypothetical protein [Lambiella insularis]